MCPCHRSSSLSNEPGDAVFACSHDTRLRGREEPSDDSPVQTARDGDAVTQLPPFPVFPSRLSWFVERGLSS